jgi:diacylglycerol kinase family enzyme
VSRAAVVVNPVKLDDPDKFRDAVSFAMTEHGWSEPMWFETTPEDPGEGQARMAAHDGADVVLACGGDGTVTASATGLAGTGVPLAVIPLGTGNLLARNLGLPIDLDEALTVALTGRDRPLDTGLANGSLFLTMAGLGLDAKMLEGTSEPVKKRFGWLAYVLAAVRHLRDRPMRVRLHDGSGPPVRRRASGIIVGNVGALQGGLALLPDAQPDDGQLDVVVLTARGLTGWLAGGSPARHAAAVRYHRSGAPPYLHRAAHRRQPPAPVGTGRRGDGPHPPAHRLRHARRPPSPGAG